MKWPGRRTARHDATAGTVLGLVSVPDGLAAGLLAGLNPLAGLYGYLVGTFTGALTTGSSYMCVQGTGAMAVLIADIPRVRAPHDSAAALTTLGLLTGAVMMLAGLLKLGRLVRFVPHAVLTGFINAIAVNIVLGQLPNFTGYRSHHGARVARLGDTLLHVPDWNLTVLLTALVTLVLVLALERTRLGPLALLVAVVPASVLVWAAGWSDVPQVRTIAEIPRALPGLQAPSLSLAAPLAVPALALAFVGLVQGAAISQSVPNPDGTYPDTSKDFRGQGISNIAAGLLRGMPVAGSMSATALVRTAGARSRTANIVAAAVMAIVVLTLADVVGYIAMPSLAAILVLVGVRTFKPDQVRMVWRTGATQATVMATTFALTLVIPLQYAVLAGVAISVVLFVVNQSNKVTLIRWTFDEESPYPLEQPVPDILPGGEVVVLTAYGSLFFASAQVVEDQLPRTAPESAGAVVVVRLRGKEDLGSTFIHTLLRYHAELEDAGCALILAGVGKRVYDQLERTGALAELGPDNVFPATGRVGSSLASALDRARHLPR
ncbi:SulP family inorganic anion transporter [Kitasatospora sp. NPDC101157]|uniref:SulP family inorganic anion transporter n=1 Tax=Kitasatospora sp. NPDC101157 TaxID=3364098 RepID=UPI0037F20426